jgi:hypothetical protein
MTAMPCPNGCGGMPDNGDQVCQSCRRPLSTIEVAPAGICFAWFGPAFHRMRCVKSAGHTGACSDNFDCGARSPEGTICGYEPDHTGPHAWEPRQFRSKTWEVEEAIGALSFLVFLPATYWWGPRSLIALTLIEGLIVYRRTRRGE